MVVGNKIDEVGAGRPTRGGPGTRALTGLADWVHCGPRTHTSQERGRQVERHEGEACARQQQALFIECSAKTKAGVEQAFEELVQKVCPPPRAGPKRGERD